MDGALFAAAALRLQGQPPLLVDLEGVWDTDHVLAVFRGPGGWGAVARSNYSGLRFREPVHRTIRDLVGVRHYRLLTPAQERALGPVDRRMFEAGLVGRAT